MTHTTTKQKIKKHLVDCAALVTIGNPTYTLVEKMILHMPHTISQNARLFGIGVTFLGIGSLSTMLRDYSRDHFNISQHSPEHHIGLHDTLYGMAFSAVISAGVYYASGAHSLEEVATGALVAAGISAGTSWIGNYLVDSFRDFTDIEPSPRLPEKVRSLSSRTKKSLGALLIAGSLASLPFIYHYTPTYQQPTSQNNLSR